MHRTIKPLYVRTLFVTVLANFFMFKVSFWHSIAEYISNTLRPSSARVNAPVTV
jgi:hypothetical protein